MENNRNLQSVLNLDKLVFDKIEFNRIGFTSNDELELQIQSNVAQRKDENVYRVTLILKGNKPNEYMFEISLTGFFSIEEDVSDELKDDLISKNSIAILMPYLRSEVSLLTAQPGVECVVLPPFNINNMMKEEK